MRWVFLDTETYYNDEYSLRKISIPEYIHSPLFQLNGCAVMEGLHATPYWVEGPEFPHLLEELRPS